MEKYEQKTEFQQSLEEIIRDGARKMLQQAVENEVEEFVKQFCNVRNEKGRRVVTRNGYLPERDPDGSWTIEGEEASGQRRDLLK